MEAQQHEDLDVKTQAVLLETRSIQRQRDLRLRSDLKPIARFLLHNGQTNHGEKQKAERRQAI